MDTLTGVVANLDNYKQLSDVSVTFGFDKSVLTDDDKAQLDQVAASLTSTTRLHPGVDRWHGLGGRAREYNYQLSNRRADAVVNYLEIKYNIPPHKFYLIGIGKDDPVADNDTRAGRAENRRVEIKLLSNMRRQPLPRLLHRAANNPGPTDFRSMKSRRVRPDRARLFVCPLECERGVG